MSEVPIQLIVAAFEDEKAADEALKMLKQAKKEKLIGIQNAAVLHKDPKGKLHIKETTDFSSKKGAALGGVAGAAVGLIAGPALIIPAGIGALIGGLSAKLRDTGFSNQRLESLGESLTPGSSAIVAVVEHIWVDEVEAAMQEVGADLLTAALKEDIAAQLESHHDVAYSALTSEEAFAVGRIAVGDEDIEGGTYLETEEGLSGSRFVATKDGFAVIRVDEDAEGVYLEGAAGAFEDEEPED